MTVGTSIFLMVVGAILSYAVTWELAAIDVAAVGVILMLAGVLGLTISVCWAFHPNRRALGRAERTNRAGQPVETFGEAPPAPRWNQPTGYDDARYANPGHGATDFRATDFGDTSYIVPFEARQPTDELAPEPPHRDGRPPVAPWHGLGSPYDVAPPDDVAAGDAAGAGDPIADAVTDPGFDPEARPPRPEARPLGW